MIRKCDGHICNYCVVNVLFILKKITLKFSKEVFVFYCSLSTQTKEQTSQREGRGSDEQCVVEGRRGRRKTCEKEGVGEGRRG